MGMAAILIKWPGPFEQIFVPPSLYYSIAYKYWRLLETKMTHNISRFSLVQFE